MFQWLRPICTFTLFCFGVHLSAQSPKKAITVDDFVSAPRTTNITPIWSPDAKSFVYTKGSDVFRYDVAARHVERWFETKPLEKEAKTEAPAGQQPFNWQNRRVSSDDYQWFPNSHDLLVTAAGDLFVEHANGSHDQLTATVAEEEDPKLSPDGKSILYHTNSNLYVLDVTTRKVRQLTRDGSSTVLNGQPDWVYPEELDLGTASWWSPDSSAIAFMQFDVTNEFVYPHADLLGERAISEPQRYPQTGTPNARVRIGIITVATGETKWMNLGDTVNVLLARAAWLPDNTAIAVERLNRVQNQLDLMLCDRATGAVRSLLHEESKTWINVADNLFFLHAKHEFLWTSERSGFRHIYRYRNNGELLGQLTQGDWQVSTIAGIDEDRGTVYYNSTEASPLGSQLYRVGLDGRHSSQITKGEGSHNISADEKCRYFIDTFSNLFTPPETTLHASEGRQLAVLTPADYSLSEKYDLLPVEPVQFAAEDGTTLYAHLIRPAGFLPGKKYPAVVSVYGGPGVQTIHNSWTGLSWEQVLARRGYAVWAMDGRGSTGRGHKFEEPIYRVLGRQEVADQKAGVAHLISMGFVDSARVGITGWSYGGYMTIHSLLFAADVFKVGVAGAPVTDFRNYDTIYTERYLGLPAENKAGYDASANTLAADKLQGKLLIIHNFEDDNVLFQNTMQMVNSLEKADRPYVMLLYPQKAHGVSGPIRKSMYEAMTNFFDQNLKQ